MAGELLARVVVEGKADVRSIVPDICPARGVLWQPPVCVVAERTGAHFNVCPFLLGVRLLRGGSVYDLDRGAAWSLWMGDHDPVRDEWRPICLRKESAWTDVGARLRP